MTKERKCTGCGEPSMVRVALIGDIKICPNCIHLMMDMVEKDAPEAVTWNTRASIDTAISEAITKEQERICGELRKQLTNISPAYSMGLLRALDIINVGGK